MVVEDDFIDESDDPELYDAIVASLAQPGNGAGGQDGGYDPEEDRRVLKEVMQLSKLEDAKQSGKLNLDHLKRKNKPAEIETSTTSNLPAKAEIKASGGGFGASTSPTNVMPAIF